MTLSSLGKGVMALSKDKGVQAATEFARGYEAGRASEPHEKQVHTELPHGPLVVILNHLIPGPDITKSTPEYDKGYETGKQVRDERAGK